MFSILIVIVLSYLAGSIPTAIITSKLILKDDIRNHGSKNAGATNVFRVMGWKPALIVMLIDISKGMAAVLFISQLGGNSLDSGSLQIIAGLSAIIGHIWTVFAKFKGGKGVGTAFGVLVSLTPLASLVALVIWIMLVLITRIVSIGSIAAGLVFPLTLLVQRYCFAVEIENSLIGLGILLGFMIIITHRANIQRLIKGQEHKFKTK